MSVQIQCPQCQAVQHVHSRLRGRRVRCPQCDSWVDVSSDAPDVGEEDEVMVTDDGEAALPIGAETFANRLRRDESEPMNMDPAEPDYPGGTVVTGSNLHPTIEVAEGHSIGLDFEDDDDPPKRKKRDEGELDMTPMVDVTFLLLIFFMVTASFSLQKSIQMPRQQSDAPSASVVEEETDELDMVEVQIDEYGAFLVLAPDWERETPGKQNLISALKEAIGGATDGMRLVITVHEAAKLQSLVDCMDAGTSAGFTELQVTQVEQFE